MALVTPAVAAGAQHPLVLQRLTDWNAAAPPPSAQIIRGQLLKAAASAQKQRGGCLPTSVVIESVSPATAVRLIFQGILSGTIKNGWIVVARHPDCDGDVVRYTIVQDAAGELSTIRSNRGLSLANESLISDTWPLALLQAEATLKRDRIVCEGSVANLGIVRLINKEPGIGSDVFGVRYSGSWSELWPINLCGRTVEITVRFTADGDGGAYSNLKGVEARLLPTK